MPTAITYQVQLEHGASPGERWPPSKRREHRSRPRANRQTAANNKSNARREHSLSICTAYLASRLHSTTKAPDRRNSSWRETGESFELGSCGEAHGFQPECGRAATRLSSVEATGRDRDLMGRRSGNEAKGRMTAPGLGTSNQASRVGEDRARLLIPIKVGWRIIMTELTVISSRLSVLG